MKKIIKIIGILSLSISVNCLADNLFCPSLAEIPSNLKELQIFTTPSGTWMATNVPEQPAYFAGALLSTAYGIICSYNSSDGYNVAIEQTNNTLYPVNSISPKSFWYSQDSFFVCKRDGTIDVSECPFSHEKLTKNSGAGPHL